MDRTLNITGGRGATDNWGGGGCRRIKTPPDGGHKILSYFHRIQTPYDRAGHGIWTDTLPLISNPLVVINECPLTNTLKERRDFFWLVL